MSQESESWRVDFLQSDNDHQLCGDSEDEQPYEQDEFDFYDEDEDEDEDLRSTSLSEYSLYNEEEENSHYMLNDNQMIDQEESTLPMSSELDGSCGEEEPIPPFGISETELRAELYFKNVSALEPTIVGVRLLCDDGTKHAAQEITTKPTPPQDSDSGHGVQMGYYEQVLDDWPQCPDCHHFYCARKRRGQDEIYEEPPTPPPSPPGRTTATTTR